MAITGSKAAKGLAVEAPVGGISAQLGKKSFPLVLRNGEIERFEEHRNVGVFEVLDQILQNKAKATYCRDLVALGLVGAGMADVRADKVLDDLPPHANLALRGIARDLVFAAFADPEPKKKDVEDGSPENPSETPDTAQDDTSKTQ